jgi:outer membrane immunogenic protein
MNRFSLLLAAGVSAVAMASAAEAADLIIETPAVPMAEDHTGNWDGVYLGVFGGYGVGEAYGDDPGDATTELDGNWIGGFVLGADFTVTEGLVVGIAGDVTYLGLDGVQDPLFFNVGYDLYWAGSLRGKVGFDGGTFLPYLTGGLAVAGAKLEGSGAVTGSDSNTHIGWTIGAGVEFAVTEDVSIDLLYKYSDYGTQEYTLDFGGPTTDEVGFTTSTITAGPNWRF